MGKRDPPELTVLGKGAQPNRKPLPNMHVVLKPNPTTAKSKK